MKSIGGRFVHSIDGRSVRGIAAFVSVWLVLVAIRRDFMNMLSWGARDLEQIYKTGAEGEKLKCWVTFLCYGLIVQFRSTKAQL